ncbi:undecaprenyl-diphosphatase [Paenibacillus ferrarius]|uniref:undecaprenyl-diphosphatase n=1 Tax=Paenibacillus ferrarius TaxID=1469647 RepID=UPI0009A4B811|nr:undecaprenyl-diphosphatase [Paenibacillus ferrarius]
MSFTEVDYHWFQMINELGHTLAVLNPIMRLFASYAEYVFYVGVVIYWFTRHEVKRRMVGESIVAACLALLSSGIIGHFFYRDRPFVTHTVLQLIAHPANASFPSDHAIGAFVIATSIWIYRKKDGWLWLILAGCIAFSRVWTGVHYPSDVLGGAFIGVVAAAAVHLVFKHSSVAEKGLKQLIDMYTRVEAKIWPSHEDRSHIIRK